jgi:predicted nucleic acid-binding protein
MPSGHPLGSKVHDGDRWIAATAIRLGLPLASHDAVFNGAPGLELHTVVPET